MKSKRNWLQTALQPRWYHIFNTKYIFDLNLESCCLSELSIGFYKELFSQTEAFPCAGLPFFGIAKSLKLLVALPVSPLQLGAL